MPTRADEAPVKVVGSLRATPNTRGRVMHIGDLVLDPFGDTAILLSEPHLSEDCMPGGEGYPNETYYVADVLLTEFGCKDVWITDDVEVISEAR